MSSTAFLPPPPPPPPERAVDEQRYKVVLYLDKTGTVSLPIETSWREFVEFIVSFVEESPCTVAAGVRRCIGKKCVYKAYSSIPNNFMAWSPVEIVGERDDENVRNITMLVLDFDHLSQVERDQIETKLSVWEHVEHTTHNNRGSEDVCLREVVCLSRDVPANQYHRFLAAAIAFLDITIETVDEHGKKHRQPDPTCRNRSRFYYRPSHPKDAPHDAQHVRGRVLDVDEVLRWADDKLPADLPSPFDEGVCRPLPQGSDWDLDGDAVLDAIGCISNYFPARRRHELALALGGMLRRAGATEDDAKHILYEGFRQGGSDDPEARAETVAHTYALDDANAMTGFTRACEIIGVDESKEFGDHLTLARNEAVMRNFKRWKPTVSSGANGFSASSNGVNGHANGIHANGVAAPPSPPPPSLKLKDLQDVLGKLAAKRARSSDQGEHIQSVLLYRALRGQPLAMPAGVGDVETRLHGEDYGIGRESAVHKVVGALAFVLPSHVKWEPVAEVLRPSLVGMEVRDPNENWLRCAAQAFKGAQSKREVKEAERIMADDARQARYLATFGGGSAGGGGGSSGGGSDGSGPPPPPPAEPDWQDLLTKGSGGTVASTLSNVQIILDNDPELRGTICWNEHDKELEVHGGRLAPFAKLGPEQVITALENYLVGHWGVAPGHDNLKRRVMLVARKNSYDPLKQHLLSLPWDGEERADTFLIRYFGVKDTPHTRRISRRWLVGSCARAFETGCKFDNVLVFEGLQGGRKSSAFEALGARFYCSTEINIRDKDAKMLAACSWLIELAEMDAIRRSESTLQKAFLTNRNDKFRPPFGAAVQNAPRRCVFVGSTNEHQYLRDPTGNRRYWPVLCGEVDEIDLPALLRDRDQLWAEAVAIFLAYERCPDCAKSNDTVFGQKARCEVHRWWLSRLEEQVAADEVGSREEDQPWMVWRDKIKSWWKKHKDDKDRASTITVSHVATEMGELTADRAGKHEVLTHIGIALRKMKFRRCSRGEWEPSDSFLAEFVPVLKFPEGGRVNPEDKKWL